MITMKDIIDDHNEKIREVSKEVALPITNEERELLLQMHEFLVNSQDPETSEKYDLRPAVGIAAIQLGIPKRMTAIHVLDFDEDGNVIGADDYALVNPKIISHTEKQSYLKDGEGCLSVDREVEGLVPRYRRITIQGYNAKGQLIKFRLRDYVSIVFQHEIDHLNGHLFIDRINQDQPLAPIPNAKPLEF